jgi:hypothetical protein
MNEPETLWECETRLKTMSNPEAGTWDLTDRDRYAIATVLAELHNVRTGLAELLAAKDAKACLSVAVRANVSKKVLPDVGDQAAAGRDQEVGGADMKITTTARGFERIDFKDRCGDDCSLQQSSAIGDAENAGDRPGSSFIWLGADADGMHLDRQQVRELIKHLEAWLKTGSFEIHPKEATP